MGKLYFRATAGGRIFGSSSDLTVSPLEWIHLVPTGHWDQFRGWGSEAGHIEYMKPFDIAAEHIGQMVTNFASYLPIQVPVYYEHSDLFSDDTRAAGWITAVEARDDGLWGKVEWTPAALQMIKDKEYKYTSPSWRMNYTDAQSGEEIGARLLSVGMTNGPFFETGLKQQIAAKETTMDELKKIAVALGLPETATLEEILAKIEEWKQKLSELAEQPASEPGAAKKKFGELIAATETRLKKLGEPNPTLETVRNELKLPSAAKSEEYVAAIQARGKGESALAARVQELESKDRKNAAEKLVQKYLDEGKLVKEDVAWASEFAESNPAAFEKSMVSAMVKLPPSATRKTLPLGDGAEPTEKEKEVAARTGQDPKALAARRAKREGAA